jgi:hypothetical protein
MTKCGTAGSYFLEIFAFCERGQRDRVSGYYLEDFLEVRSCPESSEAEMIKMREALTELYKF